MSYTDAAMTCVAYMEGIYTTKTHTPAHLAVEWRRLAKSYGVDDEEESEEARLRRARRTQSKFESMTGMMGGGSDGDADE
jgi:hypothetical protein